MSATTKALAPGSLILVTGVNGYISSHIAEQLLKLGYRVRGTARSQEKLDVILAALRQRNPDGQVEGLIVKDMADESSFHAAAEGCQGIIHVASDTSMSSDPNVVVPATVNGVKNALRAAADVPSVTRFVYTSSSIAATRPKPNVKFHVDEKSWNDEDVKYAWAPPPYEAERAFSVYAAGKIEAEQAAWDFVRTEKPHFVLNTVLPNLNVGEIMHPSQPASTAGWVNNLLNNNEFSPQWMKNFPPQYHINVVDCALIHVAALLEPDVSNERLFAFAEPYNYTDLVTVLKKIKPEWTGYPEPDANEARDLSTVSNGRAKEMLGRYGRPDFRTMEESLREQIPS